MYYDGQKVSYIGGVGERTPDVGDLGLVVASGNTASHVKWKTGSLKGEFSEVSHYDIVAVAADADIDTFSGSILSFSAREVHTRLGSEGVIDTLAETGHLGSFDSIAEEALALVSGRIRSDPSIQEAIASIGDVDAGEELVSIASIRLLQAAFGGTQ